MIRICRGARNVTAKTKTNTFFIITDAISSSVKKKKKTEFEHLNKVDLIS